MEQTQSEIWASEFERLGDRLQQSLCEHLKSTLHAELPVVLAQELLVVQDQSPSKRNLAPQKEVTSPGHRKMSYDLPSPPLSPGNGRPGELLPPPLNGRSHWQQKPCQRQPRSENSDSDSDSEVSFFRSNSHKKFYDDVPKGQTVHKSSPTRGGYPGQQRQIRPMLPDIEMPIFRKGYKNKKVYDEMRPIHGLPDGPTQPDTEPPPLRVAGDSQVDEIPNLVQDGTGVSTQGLSSIGLSSLRSGNGSSPQGLAKAWTANTDMTGQSTGPDLRTRRLMSRELKNSRRLTLAKLTASYDASELLRHKAGYGIVLSARSLLQNSWFETCTGAAILLYAGMIAVQTEIVARNDLADPPATFTVFEAIFCIYFLFELLVRVVAEQKAFFFSNMWQWNLFDTVLILLQVGELTVDLVWKGSGRNKSTNLSFMRILRILRLVRVMRLIRIIRALSELRSIIASVASSLRSLAFTLILIGFMVFIVGVFLTQLVSNKIHDEPDLRESLKYFSTLSWSCLILFQSLTGGVDWGNTIEPLQDHISPLIAVLFCLYIAFGVLCMLNVVTGVFVESACNSSAEEKDSTMVSRLQMFLCRKTDNGEMTWEQFKARVNDPEILAYFRSVDLDVSEAEGLFRLLDTDQSGTIEAEEFVMGCLRLRGVAKAVDLATLMYENRRWHRHITSTIRELHSHFADATDKFEESHSSSLMKLPP